MQENSNVGTPRRVAIVGPTASGKSALAMRLAETFGGEIITTDSLQVYRRLDIGTAKPSAGMRARVPHHLVDVVEPDGAYSAGRYVADGGAVLERLAQAGKPALLCGGTGLYFRALLFGLAQIPAVPAEVRARVLAQHESQGLPACREALEKLDPEGAAALHPNDAARILRALEVVLATGRPLRVFQRREPFRLQNESLLSVGIHWERADLYARINRRVAEMLERGWIEEVRGILEMGYDPMLKPLRSIGYKEIAALLLGSGARDGLAPEIAQRTRRYAKRQLTWFRKHPDVFWCEPGGEDKVVRRVEFFLKTGN